MFQKHYFTKNLKYFFGCYLRKRIISVLIIFLMYTGVVQYAYSAVTITGNTAAGNITLSFNDITAKTVVSDGSGNYTITVSDNWTGTVTPSSSDYVFDPSSKSYNNLTSDVTAEDYIAVSLVPVLTIQKSSFAPFIDGVEDTNDPWGSISWNDMTANVVSNTTHGMTSKFKLTYDEDNLYLIVKVDGNNTTDTTSAIIHNSWNTDCISLYFKPDIYSDKNGYPGSSDFQFRMRRASVFPDRFDYNTDFITNNTKISQFNQSTSYTQEWQIPWKNLVTEKTWDKRYFKFEIQSTDNTTGLGDGATQLLFWKDNSNTQWYDTRTYSIIELQTPLRPIISGNTSVPGVILSYFDGSLKTDTSDFEGNYSFSVPQNWSGTITPYREEYGFSPASKTYTNITHDQVDQDFTFYSTAPSLIIKKTTSPPLIDGSYGNDNTWSSTNWVNMIANAQYNSTFGMTAKFKLMYDDDNLYLLSRSEGNTSLDTTLEFDWDNDCLEVFIKIDTTSSPDGTYESDGSYTYRLRRGSVYPDRFGAWGNHGSINERFVLNNNFNIKQVNEATAFTQEWQIPWDSLKGNVNWNKKSFKFEIKSVDNTTGIKDGRTQVLSWKDFSDDAWKDTRKLSYVKLEQPVRPIISGNAGVAGAIINYTDETAKTFTCDENGKYSIRVSYNWSGTIIPEKTGYKFTASSKSYTNVISDFTNQNYNATEEGTCIITGNAGIPGALLSYTDGILKTINANSSGDFTITITKGWSGTLTPSLENYSFTPANLAFITITVNQTGQNFNSTNVGAATISGNAEFAGVLLQYFDGTSKTVTSDNSGNYTIDVTRGWSGTITPSKAGFEFSPASHSYSNITANAASENFDALPLAYTISGHAGGEGIVLNYTDTTAKSIISDASGNYSFKVSYNWSGTVTPALAGYDFIPNSITYSNVFSDYTIQNYSKVQSAYLTILKASTPPVINGLVDLNDPWSTTDWLSMTAQTHINTTLGMSAKFKLMYDEDYLYLLARQDGNTTTDTASSSIPLDWESDNFEVYLKIDTLLTFHGTYDEETYDFRMRRASAFPNRFSVYNSHTSLFSRFTSDNTNIVQINENTSFTQEWRLPWNSLRNTIAWNRKNFKFEIAATDNTTGNDGGRTQVICWKNNSLQQYYDNRTFTILKLEQPISLKINGNTGVAGVTLHYFDGTPKTVTSDGSGNYSISVPDNWVGSVTPKKQGYSFAPGNITYAAFDVDQTAQNYTATSVGTCTISGNAGMENVVLSYYELGPKTFITDASGNYSITVTKGWSGTITPLLECYAFSPLKRTYSTIAGNQLNQDFVTTALTFTISGNAGVAGATLRYTDGIVKNTTTDASGNYSLTVSCNWSGTVSISKPCYSFTPASKDYSNITANESSQNYTPTSLTYAISGNAGVAGATLSYSDGATKTSTTDVSGNYSLIVSCGWSGTVSISKTGHSFTPVSKNYSNVSANQSSQDYTSSLNTFTINGNAGVPAATLSYTDGTQKTATTDIDGNYSITIPYGWSGTITPSLECNTFTPASKTYNAIVENKLSENYTSIKTTYTISGNTGKAGVTMNYSADGSAKTAVTDVLGYYSITVPCGWHGTVTPELSCYNFNPGSFTYHNVVENKVSQDYIIVAATYTFSGNVGLAGVKFSYTDGTLKSVVSDADGNYSVTLSCGWKGTITPSLSCYRFNPNGMYIDGIYANYLSQNIISIPLKYTISGYTGTGEVTLSYTDGTAKTYVSDASGNYSFDVSCGWSGTVTPNKKDYLFEPVNKSYSNISENQGSQNYSANTTSIELTNTTKLEVYPLPATDLLNIKFESQNSKNATLYIINTAGQIVMSETYTIKSGINQKELNVKELESGIYIIKLVLDKEVKSKMMMIK